MKLIIAGSRDFIDYGLLEISIMDNDFLSKLVFERDLEIVSGTARGADRLGEKFAKQYECKLTRFPARWNTFGKSAGYIRNREMALYADMALIFWDGESRGTKHMIDIMERVGKNAVIIRYDKEEI